MKKDTVYIDNDDEITSITDKVQTAKNPIVALVLPKRCTVLQSSVNMKILNRAANNAGKKVVLITSEAALMPVAGAAGLFVAKTLQSKPSVPPSPQYDDSAIDTVTEEPDEAEEALDATKSIGELAGATAVAALAVSGNDEEAPIELGDDPEEPKPKKGKKNKNNGEKKNKKLAVPNFDSFRAKLFAVVGGLILFIGLWYVATSVLPRAKIVIKTENKAVNVNMNVTASAAAKTIDTENMVVPSITKTLDKTETKKFAATGEKDLGTKATGEVTLSIACSAVDGAPPTIPAGTGVSTGSLTFITQDSVSLTSPSFSGGCKFSDKVDVTAQNAGDQYNISSGRSFTVAGYGAVTGSNAKAMGGGTSKVVKVVSQNDCENAKNELLNTKTDALKVELEKQLIAEGYTPINDSFSVTPGKATCNPPVDAEATESTATVTFKATMTGANTAGLEQLVQTEVSKNLASGQSIFDTGVKTATLTVKDRMANGDIMFTLLTDAQTGIKQDPEAIAKSIAGKKRGETSGILRGQPGVTDVQISYRPFWVFKTPKNTKHISITFENNGNK